MGANNGATELGEILDLDALERDTADVPESLPFTVAGQTFHLSSIGDLEWHEQQAFAEGNPVRIMASLLGPDQFAAFDELEIPAWKVDKLIEAWGRHNGIDVGESGASSASSRSTGKRSRPTSARTTASASRSSRRGG